MHIETKSPTDPSPGSHENHVDYLGQEYARWQALFEAQPPLVQRALEEQARGIADALIQPLSQIRFSLPERVAIRAPARGEKAVVESVPQEQREQLIGGLMERMARLSLGASLRQRLDELEASSLEVVSVSAGLVRFSASVHMVRDQLPSGRSVIYHAAPGEEIPTLPVAGDQEMPSAIMAATDAIAEEAPEDEGNIRGDLLVPYVPTARRFFLPQWVAFDDQDQLLVGSINEAESYLISMQRYLKILHAAVALAPYMVADEGYQNKRYGMLGQLVNQGRALARYETREIIATIQRRAAANDLNRGLSLSLPYFDDQILEMKSHEMDVIPSGRIMFIPGFVVLAARKEQAKVYQDTRLSPSTRKHLLDELEMLEISFESPDK